MKALIISIGTGIGAEGEQSLVSGIVFSMKQSNPDKVFFVTSPDSKAKTLPEVLRLTELPPSKYEEILLLDYEDINKICQQLSAKFKEVKREFKYLTVDYTSGTKAMTGALSILGSLYEADTLSYVTGERRGNIVVKGTEKLLSVQPYQVFAEIRLREAVSFFNNCQFETCLTILSQLEQKVAAIALSHSFSLIKMAALAYSFWDKFNHKEAWAHLRDLKDDKFDSNKSFLGKLLNCSQKEPEPYYIADLLNNSFRRGEVEQKYDDAVARLYRATELIAQYRLKSYGIENTGDVPPDKIPVSLREKVKPVDGKIKIGLRDCYQILAEKGDGIGSMFTDDKKLNDLLGERNNSILAHGLTPVAQKVYTELKGKVFSLASNVVKDLSKLISDSTFIRLPLDF